MAVRDNFRGGLLRTKHTFSYDLAIDAHKAEQEVSFTGILTRSGTYYRLLEPEMLGVESESTMIRE
jgi:hypothetical protein